MPLVTFTESLKGQHMHLITYSMFQKNFALHLAHIRIYMQLTSEITRITSKFRFTWERESISIYQLCIREAPKIIAKSRHHSASIKAPKIHHCKKCENLIRDTNPNQVMVMKMNHLLFIQSSKGFKWPNLD